LHWRYHGLLTGPRWPRGPPRTTSSDLGAYASEIFAAHTPIPRAHTPSLPCSLAHSPFCRRIRQSRGRIRPRIEVSLSVHVWGLFRTLNGEPWDIPSLHVYFWGGGREKISFAGRAGMKGFPPTHTLSPKACARIYCAIHLI
jgi:hypothetical protein